MGAKRNRNKQSADQLYTRAKRELADGNAKEALKDAKVCYRAKATPEHRQLLEQAYVLRVQQLRTRGLMADAGAVMEELAALGPTDPEVGKQLAKLQVLLGKGGAKTQQLLSEDPSLLLLLTDEAVLDPRAAMPSDPQIRKHIEQIREALVCVERGTDDAVGPLLQDIPRTSPLGDWKLLVRGLTAFYQREQERTEENWRRLDPTRPAWRIAQTLSAAADPSRSENIPPDVDAARRRLIQRLQDASLVSSIKQLADTWQQGNLREFLGEFRKLRQLRGKTHQKLIESIVEMAWKRAVRDGDEDFLRELMRIGPAPALDPRWNRARILAMGGDVSYEELDAFERHGMNYAEDLLGVEALPPAERSIAAALACQHLARSLVSLGADHRQDFSEYGDPDSESADRPWLQAATRAYRKSVTYYDHLESAYLELATTHNKMDEHRKAAVVLEKLVGVNPDNYEAHSRLAHHYLDQDEPGKSEGHVAAAMRLHPRDERTVTLRWSQQLTMIRCLALQRNFAAAEHELEKAAAAVPDNVERYTVPLLRAALSLKAKQPESAEQHLSAALSTIEEPTAIWMQMTFVADRYKLPAAVRREYDRRYKKAMENAPTGPTAARLARFFTMMRKSESNYTGRATQERLLAKCLRRANVQDVAQSEFQDICEFLFSQDSSNRNLRKDFVAQGVQRFPDSAYLHLLAGEFEMDRGPFLCDFTKAREHMQRALDLAQDSRQTHAADLVERAQRALTLLNTSKPFRSRPRYNDDNELDDEGECDCPACRAERAFNQPEESDEFNDDETVFDEEEESNQLPPTNREELMAMMARFADQMPPEVLEMFQELVQDGKGIPQPEFLKTKRKRSSDRGSKGRS